MHMRNEATTTAVDKIEYLNGALVQHGPANDRVYLMKLGEAQPEQLVESLLKKASDAGYSKVFAKIPESVDEPFLDAGFEKEARVPGFFDGVEPASFLGFYLDSERKQEENPEKLDDIMKLTRHRDVLTKARRHFQKQRLPCAVAERTMWRKWRISTRMFSRLTRFRSMIRIIF